MSGIYEELCNLFIKPARQSYSEHDLVAIGPHGLRQNFTLPSQQGHDLRASFFRSRSTTADSCVLYLHSFNGSRLESLRYAGEVLQAGFHFCSFDFAGCGNSGGQYVSLGCNERWDVLRLVEQVRLRFSVSQFFVWGRSMGAVAAVKFNTLLAEQQALGRASDITLLGLVLDSAFISLKRMVVEAAQTRLSIPSLLVKAAFLMVSSSIEQRAGFKVEELQLGSQVEGIRCGTLLVASKEDSFVSHTHSEEIFSRLRLQEGKEIEYTRGEHYESRDAKTLASIYAFFHKRHKKHTDANRLTQSRLNCLQDLSLDKHTKSLRKYEPKQLPERRPEHIKLIHESEKRLHPSTKIILFRSNAEEKELRHTPEFQAGSEKRLLGRASEADRQYQTEKKIEDGHIKLLVSRQEKHKNGLRNKSKPNFVCRIEEICSSHRIDQLQDSHLSRSTERTQDHPDDNHCNIINDKLRKKPRNQRERIIEFKDRSDHEPQPQPLPLRPADSHQLTRPRPQVNFTIGAPATPPADQRRPTKKLSMTAQQYKNSQVRVVKGVVTLSPSIRRRDKASCLDLKARADDFRSCEQSKSTNNLITLGGETPTYRNGLSLLTLPTRD